MRHLAFALLLAALAGAAALLSQTPATAQQGAKPGPLKVCRATNNEGRPITWGCPINQACCFNATTNQSYCGPPGGGC